MIPDQLVIAVVVHDILKAGHCNQAHAVVVQIAVDRLQHGAGIRLVLQKIEGQEHIVRPVRKNRVLRLRKPFRHIQPALPGQGHQPGIVLDSVGLHRELGQHAQKFALSAAHLNKPFSFQMVGVDQMPVLVSAQLHHCLGKSSCPDHIPVIIHRLTVKLNQPAAGTLT